MEQRFDPAKDAANRDKHELPLIFGDRIFEYEAHLIIPTIRQEDEEERFKVVGQVKGKPNAAEFTWRGDLPRFISVRRSNPGEDRAYRTTG